MLIPLEDIKIHLRLDLNEDYQLDVELEKMLEAAVDYVSQYIDRSIPWSTSEASEVFPASVRAAILIVVADLFENRQGQVFGELKANPAVDNLLHFYRSGLGV